MFNYARSARLCLITKGAAAKLPNGFFRPVRVCGRALVFFSCVLLALVGRGVGGHLVVGQREGLFLEPRVRQRVLCREPLGRVHVEQAFEQAEADVGQVPRRVNVRERRARARPGKLVAELALLAQARLPL